MCGEMSTPVCCTLRIALRREEAFWGPGVAQLLHGIAQKNSLRAAAQQMGISYSKAWKIIHNAENGLEFQLIESASGGMQGGGSYLTEAAKHLLSAYDAMVDEVEAVMHLAYDRHMKAVIQSEEIHSA